MQISLTMIVRNEEEMLPRCLASVEHLVDEIVIVDTGSEDETRRIAKVYGAKVSISEWTGNFSTHRNEAFDRASGEWYWVMDADNELVSEIEKAKLIETLQKQPDEVGAVAVAIKDINQQGMETNHRQQIRLFRASHNPSYEGAIHNQPHYTGKTVGSDILLHHYGFDLDDRTMEQKYHRTREALLKQLDEDSTDYATLYYLAQVEGFAENKQKSIKYAKECIAHLPEDAKPAYCTIYFVLAMKLLDFQEYADADLFIAKGLERLPDDPDLWYARFQLGVRTNDPVLVRNAGHQYLDVVQEYKDHPSPDFRFIQTTDDYHQQTVRRVVYSVIIDVPFETIGGTHA